MPQFIKSFLWRFILDIILLGIFVRLCQNIILTITSRFISTYSTPFLIFEAVVVSAISMLFICFIIEIYITCKTLSALLHIGISVLFQTNGEL